jgi:hypothetical protein
MRWIRAEPAAERTRFDARADIADAADAPDAPAFATQGATC